VQQRFNEQIKQVIPAHEGYYAVLLDSEDPYYHLERIVGLSLLSSEVWFADYTKEFFEYVHEDELTQRHERFRNQGRIYANDPEGYGG
jgi:hypothetical protein